MQVAFMLQENQIQIILTPETEEEKKYYQRANS